MKILWVGPSFLHPTTRGGQIRTLGMLRQLHRWHEIHYVALQKPEEVEGPSRSAEYCSQSYPIPHYAPSRRSPLFYAQAAASLFSPAPLSIGRYRSPSMLRRVKRLLNEQPFDRVVCDFLTAAPNVPDMGRTVLFQHNVETIIWERLRDTASNPVRRLAFQYEAHRMLAYEGSVCRAAAHVVAVSSTDAERMRAMFGISSVSEAPTGVDLDFFAAPGNIRPVADLVFVGSMNWMPNIDGVSYFVEEILPLILARRPDCRVAIAGRTPPPSIARLAEFHPNVAVTGTVPDIRPYLWGSKVCIVPLRIGGGTRLKIYEAMAAGIPVVSTSVGAEGLPVSHGDNILLADGPEPFAAACLQLLDDTALHHRLAESALRFVASRFSWERVARCFEQILTTTPG